MFVQKLTVAHVTEESSLYEHTILLTSPQNLAIKSHEKPNRTNSTISRTAPFLYHWVIPSVVCLPRSFEQFKSFFTKIFFSIPNFCIIFNYWGARYTLSFISFPQLRLLNAKNIIIVIIGKENSFAWKTFYTKECHFKPFAKEGFNWQSYCC